MNIRRCNICRIQLLAHEQYRCTAHRYGQRLQTSEGARVAGIQSKLDLDLAIENIKDGLNELDHALDQPQDPATVAASYATCRQLERQLHTLTDRVGRVDEFNTSGPR